MNKNLKLCMTALTIMFTVFLGSMSVHADFGDNTLKLGMRGTDVTTLQSKLKTTGYFSQNATGYFGTVTKSAVISFQKSKGLVADGIVGRATFSALTNGTASATLSSRSEAASSTINSIIATGKSYMGVPYVWGGTTPNGFDCSGFTQYIFKKNGITLLRTAASQFTQGTSISKANLKAGDLVFFSTYKAGASHVGLYLGSGNFINASTSNGIVISKMSSTYWSARYLGARRII